MNKQPANFHPLIRQARQMEIFSFLSDINCMLQHLKKKKYFHTCNKVGVLNSFVRSYFHVVLPPLEKKPWHYYPKYY